MHTIIRFAIVGVFILGSTAWPFRAHSETAIEDYTTEDYIQASSSLECQRENAENTKSFLTAALDYDGGAYRSALDRLKPDEVMDTLDETIRILENDVTRLSALHDEIVATQPQTKTEPKAQTRLSLRERRAVWHERAWKAFRRADQALREHMRERSPVGELAHAGAHRQLRERFAALTLTGTSEGDLIGHDFPLYLAKYGVASGSEEARLAYLGFVVERLNAIQSRPCQPMP